MCTRIAIHSFLICAFLSIHVFSLFVPVVRFCEPCFLFPGPGPPELCWCHHDPVCCREDVVLHEVHRLLRQLQAEVPDGGRGGDHRQPRAEPHHHPIQVPGPSKQHSVTFSVAESRRSASTSTCWRRLESKQQWTQSPYNRVLHMIVQTITNS